MIVGPHRTVNGATAFTEIVEVEFQAVSKGNDVGSPPEVSKGVPSIINPYAIVVFPSLGYASDANIGNPSAYEKLIDGDYKTGGNQFSPEYKVAVPTITRLVEDPVLALKTPYNYTDFLYCKYVGKITNNHLITLRRYPAPTFDNLAVPGQAPDKAGNSAASASNIKTGDVDDQPEFFPIAQAVTWMGEDTGNKLSEIMSFTTGLNWKLLESEVATAAGNEQGSEDSPAPGVAQFLGILTGQVNTPYATQNSQYDPYNGGPYSNRVYGPVNAIAKTYKRERGLEFRQTIALTFEYELKSIGNINPKAAMLDIMSNMLALTYNNAAFWGGANRYFPQKPTYPFLGGKEGMNAWYRGDPTGFTKAVGKQISPVMNKLGNILSKLMEDPIGTLKGLATGAAKIGMIEMGKGKAPSIVAMKALLTGEPIGEWHLVVGNPYNPIAKIGNLICTESKFQFNDTLGADNFPTELKVVITVEHGRPRDAGDIQSMFNQGQGRIYYPSKMLGDKLNISSSTRNSTNDTSWKGGGSRYDTQSFVGGPVNLFSGSSSDFDQAIGTFKSAASRADDLVDKMFLRTGGGRK